MSFRRWFKRSPPRFAAAVLIAGIVLTLVNPLMANDKMFGQAPGHYMALLLPAVVAIAFLHVAVPAEQRGGAVRYLLKVVVCGVLAYFLSAVMLLLLLFAITGELI